jgi:hypothetical protein
VSAAIAKFREYLAQETLANKVVDQPISGVESVSAKVLGHDLMIYLRVVT